MLIEKNLKTAIKKICTDVYENLEYFLHCQSIDLLENKEVILFGHALKIMAEINLLKKKWLTELDKDLHLLKIKEKIKEEKE